MRQSFPLLFPAQTSPPISAPWLLFPCCFILHQPPSTQDALHHTVCWPSRENALCGPGHGLSASRLGISAPSSHPLGRHIPGWTSCTTGLHGHKNVQGSTNSIISSCQNKPGLIFLLYFISLTYTHTFVKIKVTSAQKKRKKREANPGFSL